MFSQDNLVKKTKKNIKELEKCCDKAQDSACEIAHAAGKEMRKVYDNISEQAVNITHKMEKRVKQNPLQTGLMAVGIGFKTGLLVRRK